MKKYNPGDVIGPYTLISRLNTEKWICRCNKCGSIVDVYLSNIHRQRMCKNCRTMFNMRPKKDLTGKKFGRLTAVQYVGDSKWFCVCDCGNEIIAETSHLADGHTQSCGCFLRDRVNESNFRDLSGRRFGLLTVLYRTEDYVSPGKHSLTRYKCRCDCGTEIDVTAVNLVRGNTKSCGCMGDSVGEYYIKSVLNKRHIRFQTEYAFPDLRSPYGGLLRFDFAIKDSNDNILFLVEFHGEQHFYDTVRGNQTEFGKMQRDITDKQKEEYCQERNIPLHIIRHDEDIELRTNEVLDSYGL